MANDKSAYERMLAGETYLSPDPELRALVAACRKRLAAFNALPGDAGDAYVEAVTALFGRIDMPSLVERPFQCDYGVHIEIGSRSFINLGCTFLDSARITIGNNATIGPNCQLITASHPLPARERHIEWPDDPVFPFRAAGFAKPITLEDNVWLGAGVIVLPGVTIGARTVVGAGSVVTKDLPADVIAVGNPCRVIRSVDD